MTRPIVREIQPVHDESSPAPGAGETKGVAPAPRQASVTPRRPAGLPVDLYRAPLLGSMLRRPLAQRSVQVVLLLGYGALVLLGVGQDAIPGVPELHPRMYTHATTLLFWVAWLMGLVLLVPVLGRAWCGVCPLGFLTDFLGRRGLGLAWPRWVRSGGGMLLVFAAGVAAVTWADVHKSPHGTAVLVALVGLVALGSALVWRRSGFCKGLCPVGSVLHLYSRHAPLAVRPVDPGACGTCSDRSCTKLDPAWRRWDLGNVVLQRKIYPSGCPVALYPPKMDPGACLLCLRCVRRCSSGNLGVFWGKRPEAWPLDRARVILLGLVLGLVSLALLRTWPDLREALTPGVLPPVWFSSLWIGLALPLFVFCVPAVAGTAVKWIRGRPSDPPGPGMRPARSAQKSDVSVWNVLKAHAPAFVGPVLGAHVALALVKLNAKAGYLPYLAYDPTGASTYLAIRVAGILEMPDLLMPLGYLRWLVLACFALGVVGGIREAWARWPRSGWTVPGFLYGLSLGAVAVVLGSAVVHWLFSAGG